MAEKAVATGEIGGLNADQSEKLAEFGRGLLQSDLEALGTTLDKKLEADGPTPATSSADEACGAFPGMFVVVEGNVRFEDGSTTPGVMLIGEDEASALFNVSPDGGAEDEYKA